MPIYTRPISPHTAEVRRSIAIRTRCERKAVARLAFERPRERCARRFVQNRQAFIPRGTTNSKRRRAANGEHPASRYCQDASREPGDSTLPYGLTGGIPSTVVDAQPSITGWTIEQSRNGYDSPRPIGSGFVSAEPGIDQVIPAASAGKSCGTPRAHRFAQ